jgi:hypothetical protein
VLAAAASQAHPFNANLYVVAATVLPVWFVALMFPGAVLARYAVWTTGERRADAQDALSYTRRKKRRESVRAALGPAEAAVAELPDDARFDEIRASMVALNEAVAVPVRPRRPGAYALGLADNIRRVPVALCIVLVVYGEIQAVLAIEHQHASSNEHYWVIRALLWLPVLAATAVIAAIVQEGQRTRARAPD